MSHNELLLPDIGMGRNNNKLPAIGMAPILGSGGNKSREQQDRQSLSPLRGSGKNIQLTNLDDSFQDSEDQKRRRRKEKKKKKKDKEKEKEMRTGSSNGNDNGNGNGSFAENFADSFAQHDQHSHIDMDSQPSPVMGRSINHQNLLDDQSSTNYTSSNNFNNTYEDDFYQNNNNKNSNSKSEKQQRRKKKQRKKQEKAAIMLQMAWRNKFARAVAKRIRRKNLFALAAQSGVLLACEGTIQGQSGWYQQSEDSIPVFYEVDPTGKWKLVM